MSKKKIFFAFLFVSLICFNLSAQFRTGRDFAEGDIETVIDLNSQEQVNCKIKSLDFVMILPIEDTTLIEELEILFNFEEDLFYHIENFLLCSYSNLNFRQEEFIAPFHFNSKAKRIYYSLLKKNKKLFYKIPMIDGKKIVNSPDIIYPSGFVETSDFPIIFTIAPAMKGLPNFLYDSEIDLTVTKKLTPISFLKINLKDIAEEDVSLKINNTNVKYSKGFIKVKPGSNLIYLKVPGYEAIEQIIEIKNNEEKEINLKLEKIIPKILVSAPDNAEVYFNGNLIKANKFNVDIGTHNILFILDGYKISKQIDITENKEYKISLFLNISIE